MENKITLNDGLRLLFLEQSEAMGEADVEREVKRIDELKPQAEMSTERKKEMLAKLGATLATPSFGELLSELIKQGALPIDRVASESQVPLNVLQSILNDSVYANSVPIIMMLKLLKELSVPFSLAEKSIRKTFEMLQNSVPKFVDERVEPTYRRGHLGVVVKANSSKFSGSRELFENEEALGKYLHNLGELLNS